MPYNNRWQIRRQLETELRTETCVQRLRVLASEFPFLQRFDDWREVRRFLLDHSIAEHLKDDLLRALIWSLQREGASELNTVLILAFWPALCTIARKVHHWDSNPDELWHNLEWSFLQAVHDLGICDGSRGLANRLFGATLNGLRRYYRHEWTYQRREVLAEDNLTRSRLFELPDEQAADIVAQALAEFNKRRIRRACRQHRLTTDECRAFEAIDVLGTSLSDYADSAGLNYEAAKKRHQRALTKIRQLIA